MVVFRDFIPLYNSRYGLCFTFNSGTDGMSPKHQSRDPALVSGILKHSVLYLLVSLDKVVTLQARQMADTSF